MITGLSNGRVAQHVVSFYHVPGPGALWQLAAAGPDGKLLAGYIHLRKAKAARTKVIVEDTVLADDDSRGNLIGIEILGPVQIKILTRLVNSTDRAAFRRFAKDGIPASLREAA